MSITFAGRATAIGSLPHRAAEEAIDFVLTELCTLPCIPSLPQRSPLESMLAQGAVGVRGIRVNRHGELDVSPRRLSTDAEVTTDLDHEAFGGFRAFVDLAPRDLTAVKWQVTGPITLGTALWQLGVRVEQAFAVAAHAVRSRLAALAEIVGRAFPVADQVIFVDEPALVGVTHPKFPVPLDASIDLVSTALATAERFGAGGVHCCGRADWSTAIAAGPSIISMPVDSTVTSSAARLQDFLDNGGWVAWGVVPTDRPVSPSPRRYWRALTAAWDQLTALGCDEALLRTRSLVTPECGLAFHGMTQMRQVVRHTAHLADEMRNELLTARFSRGA